MYVCMYVFTDISIYVWIYTYVHIYIYTYIHMYIHTEASTSRRRRAQENDPTPARCAKRLKKAPPPCTDSLRVCKNHRDRYRSQLLPTPLPPILRTSIVCVCVCVCVRACVKAVGRLIRPRVRALHTHGAPPDQRSTLREKCKIASNPLALTTSQRGILGGTKFRKTRTAWRPQRTCEYACVGSGHSRQSRAHAGVHRKLRQATGPTHTHADQGSWSEKNVPPCR